MWKRRFIQITSEDELSQCEQRGGEHQSVLCNLLFSDKITNNLPIAPLSLSVWLSFTLSHSNGHTQELSHHRSVVSKVPWQSITAVEAAQVLCMRKMLAETRKRIWTLHAHSAATQQRPGVTLLSEHHSLRPRLPAKRLRCITGLWGTTSKSRRLSCFSESEDEEKWNAGYVPIDRLE